MSRVEKGGRKCDARTMTEKDLQSIVVAAVNEAWNRKSSVLQILQGNIRTVLNADTADRIKEIDNELDDLQQQLLTAGGKETAVQLLGDKILSLREERQNALTSAAKNREAEDRIKEMMEFLNGQESEIIKYSESLVRRLVERILVFDHHVIVEFKSRTQIRINS